MREKRGPNQSVIFKKRKEPAMTSLKQQRESYGTKD